MRAHRLIVLFLSSVVVAGCGSSSNSGGSSSSSSASPPASTSTSTASGASSGGASSGGGGAITVKETEFALTPTNATVSSKGGSVTITAMNAGQTTHALALEKAGPGGKDLKTSSIAPGASAKLTAKLKPGTYEWYCPIDGHKSMGMVGKLTVK